MSHTINNLHRAAWAKTALSTFVHETSVDDTVNSMLPEDLSDAISDLISDLLHFALLKRFDAEEVLRRAKANFDTELAEE